MKKLAWMLALAVLAWANSSEAQGTEGQSLRSAPKPQPVGGIRNTYPGDTVVVTNRYTADGSQTVSASNSAGNLSGQTFYTANAIGPRRFRENLATGDKDSTGVLTTAGAWKIGCWMYMIPDTAYRDSLDTQVRWFAVMPRVNLTAANDTTSYAPYLTNLARGTVFGKTNTVAADYYGEQYGTAVTFTNLFPGEFLVPIRIAANGVGGARYFEIVPPDGGPLPPRMSISIRPYGHTLVGNTGAFFVNGHSPVQIRMDVFGYR